MKYLVNRRCLALLALQFQSDYVRWHEVIGIDNLNDYYEAPFKAWPSETYRAWNLTFIELICW